MDTNDKLVQKVMDKLAIRANKGVVKYGNTMAEAKMTEVQWLQEAQQEALDLAVYLEKLIEDKLFQHYEE
jgi:hypothetical protein|tara:strand:+ start:54 stop:263 length:210 start_codon:yes stop_codon:yes gene_type:complete